MLHRNACAGLFFDGGLAQRMPWVSHSRCSRAAPREGDTVGISLSILLIAVGAILAWAVDAQVSGIDLQVAGIILVVVGAIGFIASLIFWSSWGGFGNRDASGGGQNTTVVDR